MRNKRLINFRPIFLLFIVLITCIFTFVRLNLSHFYLFLLIIPVAFFILLVYKKKFVFLSISLILVLFSSIYSYFYVAGFTDKKYDNSFAVVNANIYTKNRVTDNFYYLTLSECIITTQTESNINLDGKISVAFSIYDDNIEFDAGDIISFASTLTCQNFFDENREVDSFVVKDDIKYSTELNYSSDVFFYSQDEGLLQKFKKHNQTLLINNFGEDYGNLAFALIFGDRQDANEQILQVFKFSGVMHIFSVSGLHVSLIVALIYFLLSKLPINKYLRFSITFLFLLVYCLLCSFSAPVVRASIMSLVVLFAKLFFRKPDIVNSFSIAGIILLTLNPMNLFEGGFQMSFVAVFGLIFFATIFNKIKIKNKVIKYIVMFVATSISTQIAMLPILAKFYGYVATYSLISNLFTLPLFSIFYPLLFIINLIVLIFPFLAFLYVFPKALLTVLIYINQIIATLPNGILKVKRFGLFSTVIYFVTIFCASKYLMVSPLKKLLVCLSLLVISLSSWYVFSLPKINNQNSIVACSTNLSSATLLTTKNNKFYLVNPNLSKTTSLAEWLKEQKIDKIEAIIVSNSSNFEAKDLYILMQKVDATKIYLPKNHNALNNIKQLNVTYIEVENSVALDDFVLNFIYYEQQIVASSICCPYYTFATFDCNYLVQSEVTMLLSNIFNLEIDVTKIYNNKNNYQVDIKNSRNILSEIENNLVYNF